MSNAEGEKSRDMRTGALVIRRLSSSIASCRSDVQANSMPLRKSLDIDAAMITKQTMKM